MYVSAPREDLFQKLPKLVQGFITWISGIPASAQENRLPMTPMLVIGIGLASIVIGFTFVSTAIEAGGGGGIALYLLGFCCVAGGMRRLDVLIIHQTLHAKVLRTPSQNRILGEFLTTVLLRTPYLENQKEHLGHHRAPCDENDVDVIFLRQAGVATAKSKESLYFRIFLIAFSPAFHLRFFYNRIVGNFVTARPLHRLAISWTYGAALLAPTFFYGSSYLIALTLYWLIPLSVGFQMSNFLYTATKHRWWLFGNETVRGKEKRDLLSFARVCCSEAPENDTFTGWTVWWLEALFFHLPVRLFIVVGDTVQHDLHHVAPTCDWPNSAYERQRYNSLRPERFTEVWGGMLAHLKECNLEGQFHVND